MFINKDLISGIEVLIFLGTKREVVFGPCPVVGPAEWQDGKEHGGRREEEKHSAV